MKFFHLSDLHIGKKVNGFSMIDDQRYILNQIIELVIQENPDGVLIAGDLYDKSMPSAEAVEVVDAFLWSLAKEKVPVWVISGNHDSAERVAYGSRMMEQSGIYISRVFDGTLQQYLICKYMDGRIQVSTIENEAGEPQSTGIDSETVITLLPFLRPAQVRRFYPEETIENTQQALEVVLKNTPIDKKYVNILVMHQFMAGASVCESEELFIGGSDQVDVTLVKDFDYVALGHLHGPQKVGRESVRYSGSPLKYSFSEVHQKKTVTVIETVSKTAKRNHAQGAETDKDTDKDTENSESVKISTVCLTPRHDLREIRGPIEKLLDPETYRETDTDDYLHVTLTDEGEILDAIGKLRDVYPNIMKLEFAVNAAEEILEEQILLDEKTPEQLFAEFFSLQNGRELSEDEAEIVNEIMLGQEADR